jgi:peptidyl-prolyl cis-trans isomerase SurA
MNNTRKQLDTHGRAGLFTGAIFGVAALALTLLSAPAEAQQLVALVAGDPITARDVDMRQKMLEVFTRKKPTRQEALEELINEKVKWNQALRLNIEVTPAQGERAFATMAQQSGRSAADFEAAFKQAGIDPKSFKNKLRVDLAWRDVIQKMSPGSFQVRDADVVAALLARGEQPNKKAMQYTLRQLVFVIPRTAPPALRAQRTKEAEGLRNQINSCEDLVQYARSHPEVVIRNPVRRFSTDMPPRLAQLLETIPDGRTTPPEPTAMGIEVVAVCSRQETVADVGSRSEVKQELLANRVTADEQQILSQLRRQAIIEYR